MHEPRNMEGPVEREALAAKEFRSPRAAAERLALRLETVENLSRWNAPITGVAILWLSV